MSTKSDDSQDKTKPKNEVEQPQDDSKAASTTEIVGASSSGSKVKWTLHAINVHQGDSFLLELEQDDKGKEPYPRDYKPVLK